MSTSIYIKKGGSVMVKTTITLPKNQDDFVNNFCKKNNYTKSQFLQKIILDFQNKNLKIKIKDIL